jgi:putative membrane protein insertion efficiency factor
VADAFRRPEVQQTAQLYIAAVHGYQAVGRPLLSCRIRCRYQPTCSEYSIAAVRRHGIVTGLALTRRRLDSCTLSVPMGTSDPVR